MKKGSVYRKLCHHLLVYTLLIGGFFVSIFCATPSANAAAGTNQQVNFQGRLLNAQGAVVPDGYYNIEFKIYQDGDGLSAGNTTGSPAGTLKWTEDYLNANSQGIVVKNGFLSVQLGSVNPFGSSVDWNQDTLWLSMNIAGTGSSCTPLSSCSPDGEMLPMKRLSSTPYALNSRLLGGLTSSNFVQLAQGIQTDASGTTSVAINKSGTGNILQLQSGGADAFIINNSGDITFGGNSNHSISVVAPTTGAGKSLTLSGGVASSSGTGAVGGSLVLQGGSAAGSGNNAGGNVTIDGGIATGTGAKGTVALQSSSGLVSIGPIASQGTSEYLGVAASVNGAVLVGLHNGNTGTSATSMFRAYSDNAGNTNNFANFGIAGANYSVLPALQNRAFALAGSNTSGLALGNIGANPIVFLNSTTEIARFASNGTDFTFNQSSNINLGISGTANAAGFGLTIKAGTANSSTTGNIGGALTLQGGSAAGTGNNNGGSLFLDAGVKSGSGTDGTITIGTNNAGSITIAKSGVATTVAGNLAVGGSALSNTSLSVIQGTGLHGIAIKAAATSPGDLLQLLDSNGNLEVKFSSNGQLTLGTVASSGTVYQGKLTVADGTADNFALTLQTNGALTASRTLYLPDEDGTICLRNSSSCGFVTGSGGSNFINNGTLVQNAANYYVRSNGNTVTGILEGSNGQSADILRINTYNGTTSTTVAKFDSAGSLSITNGSASALAIKNSSGNNVLTVDSSAGKATLGQSSALNGALVFKNSNDTNAITINSTAANSNYTLTLPSSAPAPGLCLETSNANATQLVFVSCANNNASIQKVTQWDANNQNTLSISPSQVGNEIVFTTQIPTGGVTVSSVSGGGVTTWTKAVVSAGNGTVNRVEMWVGTVATTGSSTITVTYSSSPGANELTATEFTASGVNSSTSWGIESAAALLNTSASATVTFPNMTAINGYELYVGYGQVQNPPATAGSTGGFGYLQTSTQHNIITYNTATSANTAYQPTASQNSSGQSNTVAAILTAFVSSTSVNNTTSLQKANFYVQAATSGSVAGVLQAASSGTADILDIKDSSANNVLTVGSTGSMTLKPATSTAAFQVQTSGGTNIFSINSSTNQTVLGASGALGGSLAFSNSTNSNLITLAAPSTVAASYTLTLPSNTPTAGLCLGTSPSNANQLIFASCATQVSAASISHVNRWSNSGTAVTTVAVSPTSTGNLLTFYSWATNNVSVSSVSGGGVTNWTKVTSETSGGAKGNIEMWRGVVTSAGSSTITVTYSGGAGTNEIVAQEFSMGSSSGTWAVDTSGTSFSSTNVTAINYPSLTALNSSELYAGYAYGKGTVTAGSTSGFTYLSTNANKYLAYNPSTSAGVAYQPTATQTTSPYASIAAIIGAYAGTSVIVNSTATQQANFNVQAATSGSIAAVLQAASSGSADVLQVKNSTGTNIAAINGSAGLLLGTSSTLGGVLTFANSANGNTITLSAPSTLGASYSLSLPSGTPAAAQCLSTSASDATKLVFSSCANQVTSVAVSYVNTWSATGAAITSLNTSPANIGDLMVLFSNPQGKGLITSVSGGGVSAWSKVISDDNGSGANTSAVDMWRGVVTSTGASTINVTFSPGPGNPNELAASEFTMGSATGSWVVDSSSTSVNGTNTTNVDYPSLTPQGTKDLYVGYASAANTMSAGSTSGYNYVSTSLGHYITYNTNVNTTTQPTASQSPAAKSITVGALIAAYSSSSVIANSTNNQQANLYVQAAVNSSVAGVFQAGLVGTADALQIMDSTGNIVDRFSNTGNLLIQPSTASASAFKVQTTTGTNVLSADTSGNFVTIGTGATGQTNPALLVLDSRTGSSADPTVLNGAMYYNATTHSFRCGVDGAWQTCSGLLYSNTSNSSASNNCSNNCAAFSTAASVPANYCQAGRVIKLHATGYFSSTSSPNLQFGVYYGTSNTTAASNTQIGSLPAAQTVTSAINNYFQINFNIICFSTSSMQGEGTLTMQTGAGSAGMPVLPMNSTTATTVVTSSAKNLYIFPIWDTASTSNTATITQMTVNAD